MAALLELDPLADLVAATPDPAATCEALLAAEARGSVEEMAAALPTRDLAVAALRYAGILGEGDVLARNARDQLLRLDGIVHIRARGSEGWRPVMTVPAFLRAALPEGKVSETLSALLQLIASARRRVIMASPFLDHGFESLIPTTVRFVQAGGEFVLITRGLVDSDSHNSQVVRELRRRCPSGHRMDVVSWEEEGLGLHMKAAVADSRLAYVGSANFTWGGMGTHAELGVLLDGSSVVQIERLLDVLADELRNRRQLQAR